MIKKDHAASLAPDSLPLLDTADEHMLRILKEAVASAYDAVMITDAVLDPPGPHIVFVNAAFKRMSGWTATELKTLTPRIL